MLENDSATPGLGAAENLASSQRDFMRSRCGETVEAGGGSGGVGGGGDRRPDFEKSLLKRPAQAPVGRNDPAIYQR